MSSRVVSKQRSKNTFNPCKGPQPTQPKEGIAKVFVFELCMWKCMQWSNQGLGSAFCLQFRTTRVVLGLAAHSWKCLSFIQLSASSCEWELFCPTLFLVQHGHLRMHDGKSLHSRLHCRKLHFIARKSSLASEGGWIALYFVYVGTTEEEPWDSHVWRWSRGFHSCCFANNWRKTSSWWQYAQ